MSFLWRLFRPSKPADDDETVLSTLAANIQTRQTLLAAIRLRERNATLLATLYALAAWGAYVAFWWFGGRQTQARARGLRALPVLAGPVLVLLVRRVVQVWYNRKGNAEEKTLQALLKEQRAKVEEIKKKTNFYSTRELLARYDASAPSSPQQQQQQRPSGPQTPQRVSASTANPNPNGNKNPNNIVTNNKSSSSSNAGPPPPPQRKWFDAVADLLVGAEDPALAARDKFALICSKCFAHNGLVPEAMWADAKYTCPKCGHFNSNSRSNASGAQSPTSPTYVSPTSASAFGRPSVGGGGGGGMASRPSVGGSGSGPVMASASARPAVSSGLAGRPSSGLSASARRGTGGEGEVDGEGEEAMEVDS
ncbi:hypothetical protein C8R44DRAFT_992583 [Mycena epipterygia]|nr:hypothetical protein C8R44DRAFT_992583 [Mycena epipterygia]